MPISFHYQLPRFRIKGKKKITEWILLVAFIETNEIEKIDFIFCTDEFLLDLNKNFLSRKTLTDVITFDYSEGNRIEAEIYISIPRVKENASSFLREKDSDSSFHKELLRVIIHGVLHCFGYDDVNERDQKKMRRKEEQCLKIFERLEV